MPVNFLKLEKKLDALQFKDANAVASSGIRAGTMGTGFTAAQYFTYKTKLVTVLKSCRGNTESQVTAKRTTAYNALSVGGKVEADKIINGRGTPLYENYSGTELDRLFEIALYTHILT